jgi:hypothetical protein
MVLLLWYLRGALPENDWVDFPRSVFPSVDPTSLYAAQIHINDASTLGTTRTGKSYSQFTSLSEFFSAIQAPSVLPAVCVYQPRFETADVIAAVWHKGTENLPSVPVLVKVFVYQMMSGDKNPSTQSPVKKIRRLLKAASIPGATSADIQALWIKGKPGATTVDSLGWRVLGRDKLDRAYGISGQMTVYERDDVSVQKRRR